MLSLNCFGNACDSFFIGDGVDCSTAVTDGRGDLDGDEGGGGILFLAVARFVAVDFTFLF